MKFAAALTGFVAFVFCSVPALGQDVDPFGPKIDPKMKAEVVAFSKRIDQLIESRWKGNSIKGAQPADLSTYFRRLNLDLIGRIPTLTDLGDFLDDDMPLAAKQCKGQTRTTEK